MVTIVDKKTQFRKFCKEYKDSDYSILVPIFVENDLHPSETDLSLLYIVLSDESKYVLSFNHSESLLDIDKSVMSLFDDEKVTYVWDKKRLIQYKPIKNLIDLSLLYWFKKNKKINFKLLPKYFPQFPRSGQQIKTSDLPTYWIAEHLEEKTKTLVELVNSCGDLVKSECFREYNDRVIKVFSEIESNGLRVDKELYCDVFSEKIDWDFDECVYSDYNLYTSTGRPSNSNHTVNYAALDAEENEKEPFISRFSDGVLVLFDYDAFHLRLIGKLIGYDLPDESFHRYLGKKYFDKEEITDEDYEKSKKVTFQLLYGKDVEEARNIEFFDRTYAFKEKIWNIYKDCGFIQTPLFGRKIRGEHINNMNPGKAFSYILQSYETEYNTSVLEEIIGVLEDYKSEIVLYTYDSFLFDYTPSDGEKVINEIKNIMEEGSMLVKGSVGKNFGQMEPINSDL